MVTETVDTTVPVDDSGRWLAVDVPLSKPNHGRWYHLMLTADWQADHQHAALCGKTPGVLAADVWRYAYTLILGPYRPRTCGKCYHAWEAAQASQEVHYASK